MHILREILTEITADEAWDQVYSKSNKYSKLNRQLFDKLNSLYPLKGGQFNKGIFGWLYKMHTIGELTPDKYDLVKEYLTAFVTYRSRIHGDDRDLGRYKDIAMLANIVEPFLDGDVEVSKTAEMKRIKSEEIDKVYEDDTWLILVPKTERASCLIGKGTKWCTAADNSQNQFDHYSDKGKLYILINRDTNEKYQFQFESQEFMDAEDRAVDIFGFIEYADNGDELFEFFSNDVDGFHSYMVDYIAETDNSLFYSEHFSNILNDIDESDPRLSTVIDKLLYSDDEILIDTGIFMINSDNIDDINMSEGHLLNVVLTQLSDTDVVGLAIKHLSNIGIDSLQTISNIMNKYKLEFATSYTNKHSGDIFHILGVDADAISDGDRYNRTISNSVTGDTKFLKVRVNGNWQDYSISPARLTDLINQPIIFPVTDD